MYISNDVEPTGACGSLSSSQESGPDRPASSPTALTLRHPSLTRFAHSSLKARNAAHYKRRTLGCSTFLESPDDYFTLLAITTCLPTQFIETRAFESGISYELVTFNMLNILKAYIIVTITKFSTRFRNFPITKLTSYRRMQ